VRRWTAIALLLGAFVPVGAAWAAQKQVLVVYSTRRDAQVATLGDRELPRLLDAGLADGVDFYSEYIDLGRIATPGYEDAFRDFLSQKYRGQRFDLLIAIQDVAIEFLSAARDELFTGTPLIFVATPGSPRRIPNSTGLTMTLRLTDTLTLASALQPGLREVFVVSGADVRDAAYERSARDEFKLAVPPPKITYLTGLPTADLEARLSRLPADAAVYYLIVNRDGTGARFHPVEYLERIAAVSSVPVYSWVDSTMGHGIVGGSLKSLAAQTQATAVLALRVLHGEAADSIAVSSPDLNVSQVDWRQLRRWGLSEARVPVGTQILFEQPSLWDRYKFYMVGAIALLLAQTALIAVLLVERQGRRQAETEVRRAQATLRASYERIRDLGSRLLKAQEEERSRIARELHDDISQQIALLSIDLQLLSGAERVDGQGLARQAFDRTQDIVKSVHDLSHRLHPARLRLMGLVPALGGMLRELSSSGIAITFTHDEMPPALSQELTVTVFRIAQEALHNALKYSKAREIAVHLGCSDRAIELSIADNGVGFDVAAVWGKGLGLVSIGERLEVIGGTFEVRSSPGSGTRLVLSVPLDAHPSPAAAAG
jgi:signal transduction histidine kinase